MRKTILIAATLTLAACGGGGLSKGKGAQPRPAALPEIQAEAFLQKRWSRRVDSAAKDLHITLVPALVDNVVYVAGRKGRVIATDTDSGKQLWERRLDIEITGGVGSGNGLVLVGSGQGDVVALDASDGTVTWRTKIPSEILAPPIADEGVVVARTIDGRVYGLSAASGERRWSYRREVPTLTLRGDSAPVLHGGVAIAGFANGKVVASDLAAGNVLWELTVAHPRGRNEIERLVDIDARPLLVGSVLYVAVYQSQVMALALGTRRILWTRDLSTFQDIDADDDSVYVSDNRGHVYALSRLTGDTRWTQEELNGRALTAPTVVGDYIAVGDLEGYVHLIDKGEGRLVGRVKTGGNEITTKSLTDGDTLYVVTREGVLSALEVATGS